MGACTRTQTYIDNIAFSKVLDFASVHIFFLLFRDYFLGFCLMV